MESILDDRLRIVCSNALTTSMVYSLSQLFIVSVHPYMKYSRQLENCVQHVFIDGVSNDCLQYFPYYTGHTDWTVVLYVLSASLLVHYIYVCLFQSLSSEPVVSGALNRMDGMLIVFVNSFRTRG